MATTTLSPPPTPPEYPRFELSDLGAISVEFASLEEAEFLPNLQWTLRDTIDQELLTVRRAEDMVSDTNAHLVRLFDLAGRKPEATALPNSNRDSAVVDLTMALLKTVGYEKGSRLAGKHRDIGIMIQPDFKYAHVDVSVFDGTTDLVIQEDKSYWDPNKTFEEAETQLILTAIAALSGRVEDMLENGNILHEDGMVCSGIIMSGPFPTFYDIFVSPKLTYHLGFGWTPAARVPPVRVEKFTPSLRGTTFNGLTAGADEALPLEKRVTILNYFRAFEAFYSEWGRVRTVF